MNFNYLHNLGNCIYILLIEGNDIKFQNEEKIFPKNKKSLKIFFYLLFITNICLPSPIRHPESFSFNFL